MTISERSLPTFEPPQQTQVRRTAQFGVIGAAVFTIALVALMGRVAYLRHSPPAPLSEHAGPRTSARELPARRGALLDRTGRPLAVTRIGYRLFVDPQLIDDHATFAVELARATGDDPARIDQLIGERADLRYVVVSRLIDESKLTAIEALNSRAIGLEPRAVREYPQGALAGQLVGFVGDEGHGLDGLEFRLNERLAGRTGRVQFVRDARRRAVFVDRDAYTPPDHGNDTHLTIDAVVQGIAERHLAETCNQHKAKAGEAIVLDPVTGEVLAMANWPAFDPTQRGNADALTRRNRCVTDAYEPGSIFKPFVHAAATDRGAANPDELIDCTEAGFWVSPGRRQLHDAHGVGEVSWDDVLVFSSNIGMAQVGLRLGKAAMHAALRRFGFGSPTGSGLPGESPGIVNPLRQWNHYSETSVPMGQEVATTPLQVARAFAAFGNGGLIPAPTIIADANTPPIYQRALSAESADHTRLVLREVVERGTGRRANSDRYRIWGKTGTAQVPDRQRGGYKPDAYTGSFVCGAPLRRPRIVVIVAVHEPKRELGYYGGVVAAPFAKKIVEETLTYLGVPEDADPDAPAQFAAFTR